MSSKPHFGFTRGGLAVHEHTADHHPAGTPYQRFNKRVALALTRNVGTMTCFWVFWVMGLAILPSVLNAMGVLKHAGPFSFALTFGFELLGTWLISTCFQAVLLPGLMVGQNLQNEAADARSAKQFEDTEAMKADVVRALDLLDTRTEGGLREVLDAIRALGAAPAAGERMATRKDKS